MEAKLTPFDSPLWEQYPGAYGSIQEDLQIFFEQIGCTTPNTELEIAFDNLCQSLWHQMTFYPALYLALPYLVTCFAKTSCIDWKYRILSAASICLATDISTETPETPLYAAYQSSVTQLQEITRQFLQTASHVLQALEENEKIEFLVACMAILGDREAAFLFILNGIGEACYTVCPACDTCDEEGDFQDPDFLCRIVPAPQPTDDQTDTYSWYYRLLLTYNLPELARHLPYYYGIYTCPVCGQKSLVLDLMKRYLTDG